MATLLDAAKPQKSAKMEEFVQRQLSLARSRVRLLDYFSASLVLAVFSLVFLLTVQLLDRAYETPPNTAYFVWGGYAVLAIGYLYWALFRPSVREINPYYAAKMLENNVENAKNSLVTWVDFEDDQQIAASIKTALSQKAAKDLKGLDLNQAITNKLLLWVGLVTGVLLLANAVVAFLPPTRTRLVLEEPANGNVTVFNNQEVTFQVRVNGKIPEANTADSVRLRLWYNPEDPETYEERPLNLVEGTKRQFSLTIPPRQVRMGFQYQILAGNASTATYTVTCKIIPEFTGFEVNYEYPTYLKRPSEQSNDPNLLAPYGTTATLIAHTNRDVKSGYIEIDGEARTFDGQLIDGQTDAIQFKIPFEKESQYRVWFTTTEGDKNSDPKRFKLGVIDSKPVFRTFDIQYDYPAYLRWKPATSRDLREPEIEAIRGTVVTLTAKTNRGVKQAQLELAGQPPIIGSAVPDEPMWVRFKLPAIMQDGMAKISFTPSTPENTTLPRNIPIRMLIDQAPTVQLDEPKTDELTLPLNGTLELKGAASDDHGVDSMTLQMRLLGVQDIALEGKAYRNGLSFLRKEDNTWPTRVEYKDFIKLQDIRMPNNPNYRLAVGNTVEFWLEAKDNCNVPPGPNVGRSKTKRFKVVAPVQQPAEKNKIEQRNDQLNKEQQKHEKQQDVQNQQEKRDPNQPPVKGEQPQQNPMDGMPPMGDPMQQGNPMPGQNPMQQGNPMPGQNPMQQGNPMPNENNNGMNPDMNQQERNNEIENAAKAAENAKKEAIEKPDTRPDPMNKVEPSEQRPQPKTDPNQPMQGQPQAGEQRPQPKMDPNQPMEGQPQAGENRGGKLDQTKEEKSEAKPAGNDPKSPNQDQPKKGEDRSEVFGGSGGGDSKEKPEPKQSPQQKNGQPDKGSARPEKSGNQQGNDPKSQPQPGMNKPEKEVTRGDEKQPTPQPGNNPKPDEMAGTEKPQERPEAGNSRPQPKKENADQTAGESRPAPKKEAGNADPGEARPQPGQKNMGDESAKAEEKPNPGQGQQGEPGELDRETAGQLDREINSPNPKVSDKAKSDVERLMRNKETRQKTRDELDKIERNAKDELTRKKAQDLKQQGEEAARNYDQEKPTEENVDQLAKKLNSKDQQERKDAEQRLKDWQKDQQTKKDLEEKTDQLKKKKPEDGKRVHDAMAKNQPKDNNGGQGEQTPKPDEKTLDQIAKDLQSNDPMKKADAEKKLGQMMNDPKTKEATKDKLEQMAKNAQNMEDKKNLDNAAQKADELAKGAKPEPKKDGPMNDQQMKDLADKLGSKDPAEKKEAEEKLKQMLNDPAKRDEAMKKMEEMAKNAKNDDAKKNIEEMLKQANEMAKNPPKTDPKDLKDMMDKLKNMDPKQREEAKKQLQEAMKDPKVREQMDKLKEQMAKNMEDPAKQKEFNDMMRELGGGKSNDDNGTPDPADPKNKLKSAELILEKFKKNLTNEEFNKALNWTEEQKAEWLRKQEATIAELKKQAEKGDWNRNRNVKVTVNQGPTAIKLDPKDGNDPLRGGRYAPPAGYSDPYKKFTEDASGVKSAITSK